MLWCPPEQLPPSPPSSQCSIGSVRITIKLGKHSPRRRQLDSYSPRLSNEPDNGGEDGQPRSSPVCWLSSCECTCRSEFRKEPPRNECIRYNSEIKDERMAERMVRFCREKSKISSFVNCAALKEKIVFFFFFFGELARKVNRIFVFRQRVDIAKRISL